MNIDKVRSRKSRTVMAVFTGITALFLSACGQGTVTGQAVRAPDPVVIKAIRPPTTITAAIDNPYVWPTSERYIGALWINGIDLRTPMPEVKARGGIDAVAYFGSRCLIMVSGSLGAAPKFGVIIATNPQDLNEQDMLGGIDRMEAEIYVREFDRRCA